MAVEVTEKSPLAEALNNVVQPKLVEVGWSTGGLDDSALSEYIILMLVNGKTQDQIAAELSNDLLNLGPDDSGAVDFARWLFEQVESLNNQINGGAAPQTSAAADAVEGAPSGPRDSMQEDGSAFGQDEGSAGQDAEMGDAAGAAQPGNIPTGPKSMRNGKNGGRRLIGQLSKAMDRTSDAALHRVRGQQGTERINSHREPPKGPRSNMGRGQRLPNGRPSGGMMNGPMPGNGPPGNFMHMSPQQQMQLFAMYEEQARMMSQILSPQQQQQMFMPPGMGAPEMNPGFQNGFPPQQQQPGRSLFDRVETKPQRPHGGFNKRYERNAPSQGNEGQAMDMGDEQASSMEVDKTADEPSSDTVCRFNLSCTKKDCRFAHQSPAAPPGTTIDVNDECPFGAACKNKKCVARHPSPAQKMSHQAEQDCKFYPNCTNPVCPFRHPSMPICRFGADCTRSDCKFTHVKTMCKYNPCLNPVCPFKHAEGQKRGAFGDKVWTADGEKEEPKEHVSERKFVTEEGEEEELIVPGASQESNIGTELVT
ncbi:MAG: hypothetical protein M1819_002434 [Sarea resinae]|nr:MAG: hypothetical protein M1819_002434 [Sarea resinae]